jgi:hypothetical protein
MTQVKKKEKIQGYLNSLKPTFSHSGDTLTLTLTNNDIKVGEMIFSVHIVKGVMKPISQRVIQMTDVNTISMIEEISHIVPLKEKDIKVLRKEILDYSRDLVNNFFSK